ncbi:MAG: small basic family protein [Bacillota bacterium]|nr:small basic family protein [Bacillota bacterium]
MTWLLPFIGLAGGIVLGIFSDIVIPAIYAQYLSIVLLAAMDSIVGGYLGILERKFDSLVLISGFFCNALLAVGLAYLGQRLDVDLYIAVVFVFIFRILTNFGVIRRLLIQKRRNKKKHHRLHKGGGGNEE